MPFFTHANGAKTHYQKWEASLEVPTLLLHGNLASNRWWLPLFSSWPGQNRRTPLQKVNAFLAMEWRGCGFSSAPQKEDDLSPYQMAQDALDVMNNEHAEKFDIVGHSTGGAICIALALFAPERVRKIVLIDSVGPTGVTFDPSFLTFFHKMRESREICSEVLLGTVHGVPTHTPFFSRIVDDAMAVAELNWTGVLSQLSHFNVLKELPKIKNETLLVHGKFDTTCPLSGSEEYAKYLPAAKLKVLDDRGHCPIVEAPELVANIVHEFLLS